MGYIIRKSVHMKNPGGEGVNRTCLSLIKMYYNERISIRTLRQCVCYDDAKSFLYILGFGGPSVKSAKKVELLARM
eukprot:1417071-Prymnesium_polylepis.1